MKKLIQIIAISCMPFLTGVAVAADPADLYDRYKFTQELGFERMGFGFAQPIITLIPGYTNAGQTAYKPVVIIAAGYDPTKDYVGKHGEVAVGEPDGAEGRGPKSETEATRHEDKVGNAIYFIDAINGKLVARIVGTNILPSGDVEAALSTVPEAKKIEKVGQRAVAGLKHSIPATITPVDSQGDGITDRVYFIDVIGNIWRLDLIAPPIDGADITVNWRVRKFAALGTDGYVGDPPKYLSNDRRFFNQLDVVRTRRPDGIKNVDAILVGSGNIAHPKEAVAVGHNAFYMIYDYNIQPLSTSDTITAIKMNDLSNAASKDAVTVEGEINHATTPTKGWYLPLAAEEKVVSSSTTVGGVAYFTSIIAGSDDKGCVAPGASFATNLYALRIHNAKGAHIDVLGDVDTPTTYKRFIPKTSLAFQQIDPFVSTAGDVSIVIDGVKTPLKDGSDEIRKLQGAGSYWRTEDQ